MKKTKEVISEERKFLRLCGDEYKQKIKKKAPMSLQDFQKFTYLIDSMGFDNYSLYFCMEMFPDLLSKAYIAIELMDWNKESVMDSSDCFSSDLFVDECNMWLDEFCNQMPLESQKKKYRLLFDI